MREAEREELAKYYDNADLSSEIERAELDESVISDPMITTSLRLPKSVLDEVRARAAAENIKPTALIRRWVEHAVTNVLPTQVDRDALREIVHEELAPIRELLADQRASSDR